MEKITTCILIDNYIDEHDLFQMAISDCQFRVSCTCFTGCTEGTAALTNDLGAFLRIFELLKYERTDCPWFQLLPIVF